VTASARPGTSSASRRSAPTGRRMLRCPGPAHACASTPFCFAVCAAMMSIRPGDRQS
jgi:hypothetical protein